jgi:ABC-type lipopolysaccharide export system ATPase subunit
MDHGGCGLLVQVEDGKIVKVEGDPDKIANCEIARKIYLGEGLCARLEIQSPPEGL